ncbi:MAG TPA: S8 family serine peptidase [Mycobacteriales bacterium]|nr:S8 family serine peptidase [Mycobacteriales bacterium]
MTPFRRAVALAAPALAVAGLLALPAASKPASANGTAVHLAAPKPIDGAKPWKAPVSTSADDARKVHPVRPKLDSAGRQTVYVDGSDRTALSAAISSVGGTVTGSTPGLVRAQVRPSAVGGLAHRPGVRGVRPPVRAVADSVTSEGVSASGADAWQSIGTGAGVKVGIVDVGFGGLAAAQASGDLPATGTALSVTTETDCGDVNAETHGTAVTEIVHDMAPAAQLFLVCIADQVDLADAATFLHDQGVSVVNMSLAFPDALARGDGTGEIGDIIRASRQQGLLWVVAAGNDGENHLRGTVVDRNQNSFVELSGSSEVDAFDVGPDGIFSVTARWEAWPATNSELDVDLMAVPQPPSGPDDPNLIASTSMDPTIPKPRPPVSALPLPLQNPNPFPVEVFAFVKDVSNPGAVRFDLYISGEVSVLQHFTAGGSLDQPASSPYAMAVGAACVNNGVLEPFSSQGPTIDGRTKPDITAFDGVSTTTFGPDTPGAGCQTGFLGTSAATPHVTGAAALVKSANPSFDAAQIENYLERHATPTGTPNQFGHGVLNMGPLAVPQAPRGDTYQPMASPQRILDTRTAIGGHQGKLTAGEIFTLSVPGLAPDATAIAVNVTGTGASTATHLDVFPAVYTGTSTLNMTGGQVAAVFTMVALGPNQTIRVRNAVGQSDIVVDLLGSFVPDGGSTFVPKNPPTRLLDTRTTTGGHLGKLGQNETFALQVRGVAGVPADATAVVVNVTGVSQSTGTFLSLFPDQNSGTSTLNLQGRATRANVTAVGIGADGSIRVRNALGSVHVVIDLQGWFVPSGGSRFVALDPTSRILDTRSGNGLRLGAIGPHEAITVQGSKLYGVPYAATAVAFNLTAVSPTTETFMTVWPTGLAKPNTSNLNITRGVVPNAVVVGTGTNGTVSLYDAVGHVDAVADIYGYFIP